MAEQEQLTPQEIRELEEERAKQREVVVNFATNLTAGTEDGHTDYRTAVDITCKLLADYILDYENQNDFVVNPEEKECLYPHLPVAIRLLNDNAGGGDIEPNTSRVSSITRSKEQITLGIRPVSREEVDTIIEFIFPKGTTKTHYERHAAALDEKFKFAYLEKALADVPEQGGSESDEDYRERAWNAKFTRLNTDDPDKSEDRDPYDNLYLARKDEARYPYIRNNIRILQPGILRRPDNYYTFVESDKHITVTFDYLGLLVPMFIDYRITDSTRDRYLSE